jgi:hypothetical protein
MVLAHTILALDGGRPARVECNTCHGQHNYRRGAPEARSTSPEPRPASASATSARGRLSFDEAIAQKTVPARPYSPKTTFAMDETISHPTFGRGFVSAVRQDKIDVTFRAGVRTLVHSRG